VNPIKKKKDFETTIEEIRKFSYGYLDKYNPSKQQLKTYLIKKFLKKTKKKQINKNYLI
jgi:regulatory protein